MTFALSTSFQFMTISMPNLPNARYMELLGREKPVYSDAAIAVLGQISDDSSNLIAELFALRVSYLNISAKSSVSAIVEKAASFGFTTAFSKVVYGILGSALLKLIITSGGESILICNKFVLHDGKSYVFKISKASIDLAGKLYRVDPIEVTQKLIDPNQICIFAKPVN